MSSLPDGTVLLYDGVCGLCDGFVQFVLARDKRATLRFATLQGDLAREIFERHPELRAVDSLIVVLPAHSGAREGVLVRSDAALTIASYLGGGWAILAALLRIVPRFLRDFGYDVVARIRYRVFGKRNACRLPTASERARFID